MDSILLWPPIAFLIYAALVSMISLVGRNLSASSEVSEEKASVYSSGEMPPVRAAAPGYRPFFVIALFFAIVHLGILVAGSGGVSLVAGFYMVGLVLALIALILG